LGLDKSPLLVFLEGNGEFFLAIHHTGTFPGHRFFQRFSGEHQNPDPLHIPGGDAMGIPLNKVPAYPNENHPALKTSELLHGWRIGSNGSRPQSMQPKLFF